MVFETPSSLISNTTNICVTIRPFEKNGIIFYSERRKGDHIGLVLVDGYLVFK